MKKGERQLTEYNKIFTSDKLNYYLTYLIYEEFYNKKRQQINKQVEGLNRAIEGGYTCGQPAHEKMFILLVREMKLPTIMRCHVPSTGRAITSGKYQGLARNWEVETHVLLL